MMGGRWVRNESTGLVFDVPEGHWCLTHANFTEIPNPYVSAPTTPTEEIPDSAFVTLPEGFPARDALAQHGYETLASLDGLTLANLTRLKGIGPARAKAITAARDAALAP